MMKKYTFLFFFIILAGLNSVLAQEDTNARSEASTASIDNFILSDAVRMYPNPVERYLTIRSSFPITGVMVYNLLGDQVKDVRNNFSRIDLSDLNSGIYMIKVYSNQFYVTKKLIKK
jgi:hypothetical protein